MPEENEVYRNRDMMLGEIHAGIKDIKEWCQKHDKDDNDRFKEVNKKMMYGAIAILFVALATGILPQLMAYFKP